MPSMLFRRNWCGRETGAGSDPTSQFFYDHHRFFILEKFSRTKHLAPSLSGRSTAW
jgi:hypothetical protein